MLVLYIIHCTCYCLYNYTNNIYYVIGLSVSHNVSVVYISTIILLFVATHTQPYIIVVMVTLASH